MTRLFLLFSILALNLLLISSSTIYAQPQGGVAIDRIQTVLRDTRGRTLSEAFCVVYHKYGLPFTLRTNTRGEALLEGHPGAVVRCIRQKQIFEAKMPDGEPSQVLLRPQSGESCFVYNSLPTDSAYPACLSDKGCEWSGWGPYGVCSDVPKKE